MDRRRVLVIAAFAGWTLLVWVGRLRNVAGDAELSQAGKWARSAMAALFVVIAAVVIARLMATRRRRLGADSSLRAVVIILVWLTIVTWLVRGVGIAIDADHGTAFKVVHTALAVVSIGLAVAARRAVRPLAEVTESSPS